MSVIARVRLYIYIIPNKWEAIARVLLQLLCLDAESSFGRCLAQCQGKQREGCCHFCGLFICGLVRSAAHGLCLCINWCTFCYWSPSWSCKLSVSKNISSSHVYFCRLMKCFGMLILQSWLYGWKTWRWKIPTQTLMVRALRGALALNTCLQMFLAAGTYLQSRRHCGGLQVALRPLCWCHGLTTDSSQVTPQSHLPTSPPAISWRKWGG